jgi:Predicted glycosyl hydrolase
MIRILSVILLAFTMFVSAYSQSDIQRVNGKEYRIYSVEQGEGIFAISRKFNITQQELMDVNPQIKEGVKVGQQILVPVKIDNKNSNDYITYTVEKSEGLYAISKKFNITQQEIMDVNPEVKEGVKVGQQIRIPVKVDNTNYQEHVVKKKQTLFAISRIYKVSEEEIIALNPSAKQKLKEGEILKIPVKQSAKSDTKSKSKQESKPKTESNDDKKGGLLDAIPELFKELLRTQNTESHNIVFLLPFMLENRSANNNNKQFLEFYAGALMAASEAKKQGISCNIHTFDTERNENKIKEILTYPELKNADLIIGPAFSNQISFVTEFAKTHKINTLIPFSSQVSGLDTNPYVFQFNPSQATEVDFITQVFDNELKDANIIFVNLKNVEASDNGGKFSAALERQLKSTKREYTQISVDIENFDFSKFNKNKKNVIIFNTEKFSTVQRYFETLDAMSQTYEISVFAQYSWQMPNDKRFKYFNISPFKQFNINYEIRNYQLAFEQNFGWKPAAGKPAFDILGYDLMRFFLTKTKDYVENHYPSPVEGLLSSPNFERNNPQSGFMNKKLYFNEK